MLAVLMLIVSVLALVLLVDLIPRRIRLKRIKLSLVELGYAVDEADKLVNFYLGRLSAVMLYRKSSPESIAALIHSEQEAQNEGLLSPCDRPSVPETRVAA